MEAASLTHSDAWAGYYTQGSTYTKVNMSFTVPTLTATKGRSTAVYTWDGLQGNKH
jgi:Peptidase A4 family